MRIKASSTGWVARGVSNEKLSLKSSQTFRALGRRAVRKPTRKASDYRLNWPSGLGTEIGTIKIRLDDLWKVFDENAARASRSFDMYMMEEDGVDAFVVSRLTTSPISFMEDEMGSSDVLSIVADSESQSEGIFKELERIIPKAYVMQMH